MSPRVADDKESACQCRKGTHKSIWYDPGQEDPLEVEMATHSGPLLPGKSMKRSLKATVMGYAELDYNLAPVVTNMGFPGGTSGEEPPCQCRRHKRTGSTP